jgi:hypothetical protein
MFSPAPKSRCPFNEPVDYQCVWCIVVPSIKFERMAPQVAPADYEFLIDFGMP